MIKMIIDRLKARSERVKYDRSWRSLDIYRNRSVGQIKNVVSYVKEQKMYNMIDGAEKWKPCGDVRYWHLLERPEVVFDQSYRDNWGTDV